MTMKKPFWISMLVLVMTFCGMAQAQAQAVDASTPDGLIKALEPYGLIEFVRSARVAIIKDSNGFHEKLKEFEATEPGEELIENEFLDKAAEVFTM